jgi:hypothetical protein
VQRSVFQASGNRPDAFPKSRNWPHSHVYAQLVQPTPFKLSDRFLFLKEALRTSTKQSDLSAFGTAQTEGMLNLQNELLETHDHASRAWLDRVKDLWSRLGANLTAARSVPEAMEVYQNALQSGCKWRWKMGNGYLRSVRTSRKK